MKNGTSQGPVFAGSDTWARTKDPVINSHMLYQLSYVGMSAAIKPSVGDEVKPDVDVVAPAGRFRDP